jgi:hypothetical protein
VGDGDEVVHVERIDTRRSRAPCRSRGELERELEERGSGRRIDPFRFWSIADAIEHFRKQ